MNLAGQQKIVNCVRNVSASAVYSDSTNLSQRMPGRHTEGQVNPYSCLTGELDRGEESAKDNRVRPGKFNLLNPTGHVIHQQFNIQQLYVLPTLYLCVLYLSENKQRLVPLTA